MEPRIQFCTSADGTRIGYGTRGERDGTPLVYVKAFFMSEKAIWNGIFRPGGELLSRGRFWVSGDRRGVGASQRDVGDLGLEHQIADIEAVVEHAGIDQFDLVGYWDGAAVAAAYAAERPERVLRLALTSPAARGEDLVDSEATRGLVELIRTNWPLAARTLTELMHPAARPETRRAFEADLLRMMSPQIAAKYVEFARSFDVRRYLPRIQSSTLVHVESHPRVVRASASQEVAALIQSAEFGVQEQEDRDHGLEAVAEFLGAQRKVPIVEPGLPQGMTAILFLDIAGSTALTTKLGDAAYRERERALDATLRSAISDAGGTPVEGKVLGDGVMAVFTSARQAIEAAQRCRDLGNDAGLPLHLGIHAGDVVREVDSDGRSNVHGGAVQLASRVQAAAAPGEILVSDIVRGLARTSAGVAFEDRGEHELKGIVEPQRLFAVREQE